MDSTPKHPNAGLDEEAFAQTLASDHGPGLRQAPVPEAKDGGIAPAADKTVARQPPWIGKIMGHFKLLRLIGKGAMGMVIQAEDIHLKRIVALKVLRKKQSRDEKGGNDTIEQFFREARAAAAIEHPNIVRVYEINQHTDWWYIAMEMVAGNSLQEIVKAVGALPAARACPIIADAATGLQVAHEVGIIHRDIKPSNILVTRNGHGKISDFGLVRIDDPDDPFDVFEHQSIGTPLYMAPEIIRREAYSPAVDIYSLGATLYHVLAGRPPYTADKMEDVLKQHLHADPPDILQYQPGCSPPLAALIQRMMAKDPALRPAAAEVAAILHAESIAYSPESAGAVSPGGSTLGMEWQGILPQTRTSVPGQTADATVQLPALGGFWSALAQIGARWKILGVIVILLALGGLASWLFLAGNPKPDRRTVEKLFPDAPSGYGNRNAGFVPKPSSLTQAPAFSWKGKVDTSGVRFVASRSGGYFYSIDDKRAVLIRADQFVGYPTAEQAIKDNKQPAP